MPLLLGKAQKSSTNAKNMTVLSKLFDPANENRSLKFKYFWSWFFFNENCLCTKTFRCIFRRFQTLWGRSTFAKQQFFTFVWKILFVLRRYCGLLIMVLVVLNTFWTFLNFYGSLFDSAKVLLSLDSQNVCFLNDFRHLWDHPTFAESLFWEIILWFCEGTVDFWSSH